MHALRPLILGLATLALLACGDGAPSDTTTAGDPCGGIRVGDGGICVYLGAINETGFLCPAEMPFSYFADGFPICADDDALEELVLEEALHDAAELSQPETPSCVDLDHDGLCAIDDPDDDDPAIDASGCAEDADDDGSCAGADFDDDDPAVRDVGLHPNGDGWDLVGCEASEAEWDQIAALGGDVGAVLGVDACQGVNICLLDPAGWYTGDDAPAWIAVADESCPQPGSGYLTSSDQLEDAVEVCDGALCWWSVVPCRDDAGQVAACPGAEEPCRDDDRDGVCDR